MKKTPLLLCLCAALLGGCGSASEPVRSEEAIPTAPPSAAVPVGTEPAVTPPVTDAPEESLPVSHKEQFSPEKEGIYNYCPSVMQVSEDTRYIYYCTNRDPYRVVDYIGCRRGSLQKNGEWSWGEETLVLSPGSGSAWDAHHTCDPSVIAGEFHYQGEVYGYLMAYLGCTSYDNQNNKIGLAVSKAPNGPFVKVGSEPLVDFHMDPFFTGFQWGVGQPSLINLDRKGRVLLVYTQGDSNGTRVRASEWDLSDLNVPVLLFEKTLHTNGLFNLNGGSDYLNNADAAWDSEKGRLYLASDCHPNPDSDPNFIASHFRITYFTGDWKTSVARWYTLATVGPNQTGAARNHNVGVLRDAYGHLLPNGYLSVYYTVSVTGGNSLWSYRIHDYHVAITK